MYLYRILQLYAIDCLLFECLFLQKCAYLFLVYVYL